MRTLVIVLGLAVMGCGRDKFDEILVQLGKFKAEMCACKDAACADKVSEARRDYKKTMRDTLDKDAKPSADQDRQGKAIEADLQACRKTLMPPDEVRPENPE